MARVVKAGGAIAAAGTIGFWFHDSVGPGRLKENEAGIRLPDFSIPDLGPRMSIIRGRGGKKHRWYGKFY
jgi:hypothetical protein